VAAALLALVASSFPAPGVFATSPSPAHPAPSVAVPNSASAAPAGRLSDRRNLDLIEALADGWALDALADAVLDVLASTEPGVLASVAPAADAPSTITLVAVPMPREPKASPAPSPVRARAKPVRASRPAVRAAARPAAMWTQLRRGLTVAGMATWYPGTLGYAGIAHVAMPGARYLPRGARGPRAKVCSGGRCTVVRVVDACACRVGSPNPRLVDLSAPALRLLGLDPRRGVYEVRVTLLAP
jgi:hypothetical protein